MSPIFIFIIVIAILIAIFLGIFLPILIIRIKYERFVECHSVTYKKLRIINTKYCYKTIKSFKFINTYDNESMFGDISCKDYLTYELVYYKKQVNEALKDTLDNKTLYEQYLVEFKSILTYEKFDTNDLPTNLKRLYRFEREIVNKNIKKRPPDFYIPVRLILTNINGSYKSSKTVTFRAKEIKDVINKLNQKRGEFYLNDEIWKSICRVERGKVTNKMRFAIYERDNYRCKKCGRKTNDLEIDHIIPIAKGGKTTYNNLQTLCHRCNCEKGASIEKY